MKKFVNMTANKNARTTLAPVKERSLNTRIGINVLARRDSSTTNDASRASAAPPNPIVCADTVP